ncbi:hypothetical protein ACFQZC_37890 [Streptacidiphilus monticola]
MTPSRPHAGLFAHFWRLSPSRAAATYWWACGFGALAVEWIRRHAG